ncbi:meiosis 1 arrest protein [Conger conger]|uniref:meiosis 1 arrest protein n=1 Tax=Conger conger TaxID=82655 RepID=UPI002A5A1E57|nr:meiosis 1 arrest protein [Conger conger]
MRLSRRANMAAVQPQCLHFMYKLRQFEVDGGSMVLAHTCVPESSFVAWRVLQAVDQRGAPVQGTEPTRPPVDGVGTAERAGFSRHGERMSSQSRGQGVAGCLASFARQPPRVLVVDTAPPWWREACSSVCHALERFLTLTSSLQGPCRLPLLSLYATGTHTECLMPFTQVKGNLQRLRSCVEELRSVPREGCVGARDSLLQEAVQDGLLQFKQYLRHVTVGGPISSSSAEVTVLTSRPGGGVVRQLEAGLKDTDLVNLRRLVVVCIAQGNDPSAPPEPREPPQPAVLDPEGLSLISGLFSAPDSLISGLFSPPDSLISGLFSAPDSLISGLFSAPDSLISDSLISGLFSAPDSLISGLFSAPDSLISGLFSPPDSLISGLFSPPDSLISDSLISGLFSAPDSLISGLFSAPDSLISGLFSAPDSLISGLFSAPDSLISDSLMLGMEVELLQVENDAVALETIFKGWLHDISGDREHLHLLLPGPAPLASPVCLKCDIQERLLSPALLSCTPDLGANTETVRDPLTTPKGPPNQSAPPHRLTIIKALRSDGVCESVLYGLPLIIKPTNCWQLDWDEMEANNHLFHALCHALRSRDWFLLAGGERVGSRGGGALCWHAVLQPSASLSLLLKPVASAELLLPCTPALPSTEPQHRALSHIQGCLAQLEEDPVFNPLSLTSHLYPHLRSLQTHRPYPYRTQSLTLQQH